MRPAKKAVFSAIATFLIALALFSPTVDAAQTAISVQFEAQNGNSIANVVTGTAGLVPVNNWNTAVVNSNNGTLSSLKDNSAAATSATVTWVCPNTWSNGGAGTGGNDSLFSGYLDDNQCSATVTAVPYAVYDVYIYTHGDAGGGNPQGPYWVDSPSVGHFFSDGSTNGTGMGQFQICQNDSTFVPSLSRGVGTRSPAAGSAGNTVLFQNVSGSSFKITTDPNGRNGFRGPLNGFQIVDRTNGVRVTNISPKFSATAGGAATTITGTNFSPGNMSVTFGGVAGTITASSTTSISVTAPAGTAGSTVDVIVTNTATNDFDRKLNSYYYGAGNPVTVTAISPNSGSPSQTKTVTITGTNFTGAPTVQIGGLPARNVTLVSSTSLTCVTPIGLNVEGAKNVVVTLPDGINGTLTGGYTVTAHNADAISFSFNHNDQSGGQPAMAPADLAGKIPRANWNNSTSNTNAATDSNLVDNGGVNTGVSIAWTTTEHWTNGEVADAVGNARMMRGYNNPTSTTPQNMNVVNVPGGFTNCDVYIYLSGQSGGATRHGNFTVNGVVKGANIGGSISYPFAGSGSDGFLQVPDNTGGTAGNQSTFPIGNYIVFPNTAVDANGTILISLLEPDNDYRMGVAVVQFIVPVPTLGSISPSITAPNTTTTVTFTGTNFRPNAQTILFGSTPATNVTYVNATTYTCTCPALTTGTVDVTLIDVNGYALKLVGAFVYGTNPPTVTSLSTTSGPVTGGTPITITGTNFVSGSVVKFGGTNGFTSVNANNIVFVNSTTLTCNAPISAPIGTDGPCRVSVTNPDTTSGAKEAAFNYLAPAPTVTSVVSVPTATPANSGPYNTITSVQINGTGFAANFLTNLNNIGKITCGGQTLLNLTYVSATQLTGTVQAMTSAMSTRNLDVIVTNPDGNVSAVSQPADYFTYILRDPENDTGLQPGVIYRYFNNTNIGNNIALNQFPLSFNAFNKIGVNAVAAPFTHPTNANLFDPGASTDNIAVDYVGILNVPADGIYFFHTPSDDASVLYIGTTNVINNNGGHGAPGPAPDGSIGLKAGFHRIRVQWTNGGGGFGLNVQWNGPTFTTVEDIPMGSADFSTRGVYCDATPTITSLNTVNGPLAGATVVNVTDTGSNFTTPASYPNIAITNPVGASTLTGATIQGIALTLSTTINANGQFAISGQSALQIRTPAGIFAGGAPIVLTTMNGLTAVLQPGAGGYSYTSDSTNRRTPENPSSTVAGVNVKFFRTGGSSTSIAGTGAVLPSGGVTALDTFNPIKGLSLGTTTAATNIMTGPLADPNPNGGLLVFRNDDTNFYMKVTGYFNITLPGLYTFVTNSDDESRLFLGSTEVVTNIYPTGNAGYAITAVSNSINLAAGKHQFTIQYGQNIGNRGFALQYQGPDQPTLGFVPDSVLSTDSTPPAFATTTPLTPVSGSFYGNTTVTATGTNFVPGAKIFVNGLQAPAVNVAPNGLSLTFRTPPGNSGSSVNVVIVNPNGMPDTVLNAFTYDASARPPAFASVIGSPCAAGAYFRYYSSGVNGVAPGGPTLPNFAAFTPSRVGVVPSAEYVPENTVTYPATQADGFSLQYTGYLLIPADGTYSFYTASDDGSTMYLGGTQVVIDNNRGQGITTRTGPPIALLAGLHEFTVQFAEGNGGYGNYVGWGTADGTIPMDPAAVYTAGNNTTTAHGGAPTTRIPNSQYYYIPPTFQSSGTTNWSNSASWDYSTNVGLGAFGPVQNTNVDDGQVDSVFRFNGNGVAPFTAVNDSINNTPVYLFELNSNINGNVISGNTLKSLGASQFVTYADANGIPYPSPSIIQNGTGTVNISAPIFNRDKLTLTGNGTGIVNLSGIQTNYANSTDIKNIIKTGLSVFVISGNASTYSSDGTNGFVQVDRGVLAINGAFGASTSNLAKVGVNATIGTLRGIGNFSGKLSVGTNGTVFPGDPTVANTNTPADTTNQLTNGTLGNLTTNQADFGTGGTLRVRVYSPNPTTSSSDKLTLTSNSLTLAGNSVLNIHVQAGGTFSTPVDTLILDLGTTNGLAASAFNSVVVSSMTLAGGTGNIGSNLQVVYKNTTPGNNTVVGIYTNGDGFPPTLSGGFNQVFVRLSGNVTPVTVDAFSAKSEGAGVAVEWRLASEYMNLGFNICRRSTSTPDSAWVKVNPAMIPGRLTNPSAQTYRFYDWAPHGVYQYRLESIDSATGSGEYYRAFAGPVTVDETPAELSPDALDSATLSVNREVVAARGTALMNQFAKSATLADRDIVPAQVPSKLGFGQSSSKMASGVVKEIAASNVREAYATRTSDSADNSTPMSRGLLAPGMLPRFLPKPIGFGTPQSMAKVVYTGSGVVKIPSAMLPAGYDARKLRIQREGRALTALAVVPDGVVLYGQGYADAYTKNDALFLTASNSVTPSGAPTSATGLFSAAAQNSCAATTTHQFNDVYFDWSLRPYNYPPYFSSQYLTQGGTASFVINTDSVSSSAAMLTVNAWSLTSSDSSPDHALQAFVNGVAVGQVVWKGGGRFVAITFNIPAGVLTSGSNNVDLVTPTLDGVVSQIALVHSLSVSYTKNLTGAGIQEIFNSGNSSVTYEVSNLTSTALWVVDARFPDRAALVPYETQIQQDGTVRARFNAPSGGTGKFLVVPAGAEIKPLSVTKRIVKPAPSGFRYIATGPAQFAPSVQSLLLTHSKEGIKAVFIDQEQLFDYYNYGRFGPVAIQNAVRSVRPEYLLLVGRTTYDYNNSSGANVDPLCPSFLVSTTFWSQTTSDSILGDLGRGYPEVKIGRLPANNAAEAAVAVEHILNYPGLPISGWRGQVTADVADLSAGDFPAQGDQIIAANPTVTWTRNYLGITSPTAADATEALRQAACGGADIIIYNGHGSAAHLGNSSPHILDTTSVQAWTGDVVFMGATCTLNWVAKAQNNYRSVPIQALVQPQGGMAASIGTTTYMQSGPDVAFVQQLLAQCRNSASGARWGDVLLGAQQWAYGQSRASQTANGNWYLDLSKTECILGDPAMPVRAKSKLPAMSNGIKTGTF